MTDPLAAQKTPFRGGGGAEPSGSRGARGTEGPRRLLPWLLPLALPALVAACSTPPPPPPCPKPGIVDRLSTGTTYRPGTAEEPANILYRTALVGFNGGCTYSGGDVDLKINVDLSATPGPAYRAGTMPVRYFVAVADPKGTILDKQTFGIDVPQAEGTGPVFVRDALTQTIKGVPPADGPGYRVYLGLDLPEAEAMKRLDDRP
jgi:hypothetical protein